MSCGAIPTDLTHEVEAGDVPMVNASAFEELEDAAVRAGFVTVIIALPAATKSLAGIVAVNRLELTYVVVRALLFQLTTSPFANVDP